VETLKKTASQFIIDPLVEEAGLKDLAKLMKDLRSGVSPSNVWSTLVDSATALENYDATTQLNSYKNSIKLGHSAIVIAHSQGNLFTNVIYDKIATEPTDKWMTKYFYMIGVASPAGVGTGPSNIEIVTFDNDPISLIPDSIGVPITNPLRSINWIYEGANANQTRPFDCLDGNKYPDGAVPQSCVATGDPEYSFWSPFDNDVIDFHLFTYYMNTEVSRVKIVNFIDTSLKAHADAASQWNTNEELNKNTCDYKITVKHRFDATVEMPLEVYPFAPSKKLYQVNGEYVKASCGGQHILDEWDGKQDNECLLIDNPQEEKIFVQQNRKLISTSGCTLIIENIYRNGLSENMKNGTVWIDCIGEWTHYYAPELRDYASSDDFLDAVSLFISSKYEESDKKIRVALDDMKQKAKERYGNNITFKEYINLWSNREGGWVGPALYLNSSLLSVFCERNDLRDMYSPGCYKSYYLEVYN